MSGMCALLICGYGQNVPPCTSALGQWVVFGPGGATNGRRSKPHVWFSTDRGDNTFESK